MPRVRAAGTPAQRLLSKVCFKCKTVTKRLGSHLKSCTANPALSEKECLDKAKKAVDKLLAHAVVKVSELRRLSNIQDKDLLFYALKGHHAQLGHVFDISEDEEGGGDAAQGPAAASQSSGSRAGASRQGRSPDSGSPAGASSIRQAHAGGSRQRTTGKRRRVAGKESDAEQEAHEAGAKRSRVITAHEEEEENVDEEEATDSDAQDSDADADPVLKADLANAAKPRIFDPHEKTNYANDSVKYKVREAGLYRRFGNVKLLLRFARHKADKLEADAIIKQDVEMCARVLAFIFEQSAKSVPLKRVNTPETVAILLTYNKVKRFLRALSNAGVLAETKRSFERAVFSFIDFLLLFTDLSSEAKNKLQRSRDALRKMGGKTRREITRERHAKAVEDFQKPVDEGEGVRANRELFRRQDVDETLEEILTRVSEDDSPNISLSDYNFVMGYCITKLNIFYSQRAQVAKKMTLKEWAHRKIYADGRVDVGVGDHKTAAKRPLQHVVLSKEDANIFAAYLTYFRQKLCPLSDAELRSSNKPFFINFTNKSRVSNPTEHSNDFQKLFDGVTVLTSRGARHAVETQSRSILANNPAAQESLSLLLGHTRHIALSNYTDPRAQHVLTGADALDLLEAAGNVAPALHIEEDESGIPESWNATMKEQMREKYLGGGVESKPPTEWQLRNDPDLCPPGMVPRARERIAKSAYDYLRNTIRTLRAEYIAKEIFKTAEDVPSKKYTRMTAVKREKLKEMWAESARAILKDKKWTGMSDLSRGVFPALVARLCKLQQTDLNGVTDQPQIEPGPENLSAEERELGALDYQEQVLMGGEGNDPGAEIEAPEVPVHHERGEQRSKKRKKSGHSRPENLSAERGEFGALEGQEEVVMGGEGNDPGGENEAPEVPVHSERGEKRSKKRKKGTHERQVINKIYSDAELIEHSENQTWPGLVVRENLGLRGRGVFASESVGFVKDQVICDYKGCDMSERRHYRKFNAVEDENEQKRIMAYRFQYKRGDKVRVIEAHEEDESVGRLLNHSKKHPNVKPRTKVVKAVDGSTIYLPVFYARRTIQPGEELLWNYGEEYARYKDSNGAVIVNPDAASWFDSCPCAKCSEE